MELDNLTESEKIMFYQKWLIWEIS
jgi:hypothetical protein